jgi:isoamylase
VDSASTRLPPVARPDTCLARAGCAASEGSRVRPGRPLPLGVDDCCDGFNFAVFSRHAERIELAIFESITSSEPLLVADLSDPHHRTGDIWHALVDVLPWGGNYAYRVYGPWSPEQGHRFDASALLLDPYALAVASSAGSGRRSVLVDQRFDWDWTTRPQTPWHHTVIYETHVRGLTIDPSANCLRPGTFLGVVEKIPHLRELGITAVELMPVQEFDDRPAVPSTSGLTNYWGYNTIAFYAPHRRYAASSAQVDEFKIMVRELHRAGIEVILDIAFNHTAEGNERGPLLNFRGFDNAIYYMLGEDKRTYQNFSGCGNTLNCNHPVVRDYIIGCLRYWATEMQVDGFRFDLASVLGRDEDGNLTANPPLLEGIAEDPILRDRKLIAEAWDAGGAYQVGSFPGLRWAEWNGRFRDDVRRFWRGDAGMTGALASRLCGSADLYQRGGKEPVNSVNFITCHDGFTFNDLVSYAFKHNEANGEDNGDGSDANFSANYGVEGPTEDPEVNATRLLQIKNMLATLFLSRGVPMLLGGDEFGRTQQGNNNAYCQDNEVSWYDWRLLERNQGLFRFVRELIALRQRNPVLCLNAFYTADDLEWFGPPGSPVEWDGASRALGVLVRSHLPDPAPVQSDALCLLFNAGETAVGFDLPQGVGGGWRICIDTANASPDDVHAVGTEPPIPEQNRYWLGSRSLAVLAAR